jgi:Phytanoyl-CoA dioxygenase (PhyH)
VSVAARIRSQLARRAPGLDDRIAVAAWRRRNRDRALENGAVPPALAEIVERLHRDGVAITDAPTVFGDPSLYESARARAEELYRQPRTRDEAEAGSKATFLTKLATGSFEVDDPFATLALNPSALAVANGYLELRSTLRALDLWLTEPTPGPAIQTQLWHRDADDIVNVKMFVYFTDVTRGAGPLCYAPRTHPLGDRRRLPEHDDQGRSTDEQLAAIVPEREWVYCEGSPGTVVFADTCGYHKQVKPSGDERMLLVSHYVSGTPFVPKAVEILGADAAELSEDQFVALHDRNRG